MINSWQKICWVTAMFCIHFLISPIKLCELRAVFFSLVHWYQDGWRLPKSVLLNPSSVCMKVRRMENSSMQAFSLSSCVLQSLSPLQQLINFKQISAQAAPYMSFASKIEHCAQGGKDCFSPSSFNPCDSGFHTDVWDSRIEIFFFWFVTNRGRISLSAFIDLQACKLLFIQCFVT